MFIEARRLPRQETDRNLLRSIGWIWVEPGPDRIVMTRLLGPGGLSGQRQVKSRSNRTPARGRKGPLFQDHIGWVPVEPARGGRRVRIWESPGGLVGDRHLS